MNLSDYESVAGRDAVDEIRLIASRLRGWRVVHVNSTAVGGGVAEILSRMVPLMKEVGIDARWEVMRGTDDFFAVTKSMHNALQGKNLPLTEEMRRVYEEAQEANRSTLNLEGDIVIIHDPQPAGLLTAVTRGKARWVWRCHIDLSHPDAAYWDFLRDRVSSYDGTIFSSPKFARETGVRTFVIPPSIDPLSDKNRELEPSVVRQVLEDHGIDPTRPVITQVSRFDLFKDPFGVIEAWKKVKEDFPCQLVLAGGSADDDPEGASVLAGLREAAAEDKDIHVLCLPPTANLEINALQRGSTIILQKSTKEGFGLTVSEALWKGKPVIAGAVGGITIQIKHKLTGMLVNSVDGAAYYLKYLLSRPEEAAALGRNGREHVRQNFLLTRHLRDYLVLVALVRSGRSGLVTVEA
ncbi:MAG: glycosyltransferase [Planctomycetes bacterium]|nr:glycosyltransferase [Planctomycetota bacterium]